MSDRAGSSGALAEALAAAGRFDRGMISWRSGLLAAIPVVAVLGGGIAAGDPVAGVSMGAGAMLIGIAWRTQGGRPPLALMATDTALMALSTFVGSVTGSVDWLHLLVLCGWSYLGGLLIGAGNRGGVIGTQAIIAVVVFGRFSEPPAAALGLAGLVLGGGLAQVLFLYLVRWPSPLQGQRMATAAAYRGLGDLAASPPGTSALPAAAGLDEAQASLAAPALLGDGAIMTLRSLVDEGHRLRVQLSAIHTLLGQAGDEGRRCATRVLGLAAKALRMAAAATTGDEQAARELEVTVDAVSQDASAPVAASALDRRLAALAGQLRAVASLAPAAGDGAGLRNRRPQRRANRPGQGLRADLAQIRDNANLRSAAGRHALRLAVVVPLAELISRQLPLERGYWMVVAAATVLRPDFGATLTRGAERVLGTALGVGLAGGIAVALHPAGGFTVVLVGLLAWAGYSVFPASFALGFAFITALVVFLLNAISPDTLATAGARLLDTLVGGAIGLLAYALWPTWSHSTARQGLAELVAAQRAYLKAVLDTLIGGRQAPESEMRPLGRRVRLARTNAEAAVARSLSEPEGRRIDAGQSQGALGALRRLTLAAHVLRLDAQDDRPHAAHPELAPLAGDLDDLLGQAQAVLAHGTAEPRRPQLPSLRDHYEAAVSPGEGPEDEELDAELDEIVDAANGLASVVGLEAVDASLSEA